MGGFLFACFVAYLLAMIFMPGPCDFGMGAGPSD